jgi:hypothetical protein
MSYNYTYQWGPLKWAELHKAAISTDAPLGAKFNTVFFGKVIKVINSMPCIICKQHAIQYLTTHPNRYVINNDTAELWAFDFHNHVNRITRKKMFAWEDYLALYEDYRKKYAIQSRH